MVLTNGAGALVLANACTRATFAGPPLVALGEGLAADDDRWLAALAFAARFSTVLTGQTAPIIGATSRADLDEAFPRLALHSRWWRADCVAPPEALPASGGSRADVLYAPVMCGPVLVLPSPTSSDADALVARDWCGELARPNDRHSYGIGLSAATSDYPWLSPPYYRLSPYTYASQLDALVVAWLDPPRPTAAQHAAKWDLMADLPTLYRCLHPSLLSTPLARAPTW